MTRTPAPPPAIETMTPAQLARRRRVIEAVIDLVAAGRLDEMSMKDVSERSGVALGTIYRYFSSRDHVAAAALLEWGRALDRRRAAAGASAAATAGDGDTTADQLVAILRRAVRAYERQPAFARLLMLAATSTDPFASECYTQMGRSVYGTLGAALGDLEPGHRQRVLDVVGAVWYQAMIEWVNDRKTIAQVYEAVESAARLVLGAC